MEGGQEGGREVVRGWEGWKERGREGGREVENGKKKKDVN